MLTAWLSIGSVTVFEGNSGTQNAAVTVNVSEPHSNAVSVDYRTADGSASAGSDYKATIGTLTFNKNEMSKTVLVPVIGDHLVEPSESFFVNLQNAKGGARISNGQAIFTILDDEPHVSIGNAIQPEGHSGTTAFNFTVSLSAAYDVPVTVNYATADGTAKAGSDYVAASGSVVFAAGETSKTIAISVNGNRTPDPERQFSVKLSSPSSNASITNGIGSGIILDDEPRISINDVSGLEAQSGTTALNFTVSLSTAYDQPVTVNFVTADGSAKAGTDYVAKSGSVVIAPGETTKTIPVLVSGSTAVEPDKTFSLILSTPNSSAAITDGVGVGTILDQAPRISIIGGTAVFDYPGSYLFYFTVSLSAPCDEEVTVNFATFDGTAIAGQDYAATAGMLTFAPGETTQYIGVPIGVFDYYDRYFSVALSEVSSNALIANDTAFADYYYLYYYDPGYYDPGYYY